MADRTFRSRGAKRDPITFTLEGDVLDPEGQPTGEQWTERFRVLDVLPGGLLDDLASSSTVNELGQRVHAADSVVRFFEGCLVDPDLPRFQALVRDKTRPVEIDVLGEVLEWVLRERVPRPTSGQQASPGTPSPAGLTLPGR